MSMVCPKYTLILPLFSIAISIILVVWALISQLESYKSLPGFTSTMLPSNPLSTQPQKWPQNIKWNVSFSRFKYFPKSRIKPKPPDGLMWLEPCLPNLNLCHSPLLTILIQKSFILHLLCARHCMRWWEQNSGHKRKRPGKNR